MCDPTQLKAALNWWHNDDTFLNVTSMQRQHLTDLVAAAQWAADFPTDEQVEAGAKALAYEAGKIVTDWETTPGPFLNPWREQARIALVAVRDTMIGGSDD